MSDVIPIGELESWCPAERSVDTTRRLGRLGRWPDVAGPGRPSDRPVPRAEPLTDDALVALREPGGYLPSCCDVSRTDADCNCAIADSHDSEPPVRGMVVVAAKGLTLIAMSTSTTSATGCGGWLPYETRVT